MPTGSPQAAHEEYDTLKAKALACAGRGDRVGAWQRWEELRSRFPGNPDAYVAAAAALRELGRLDEAERLLQEAAGRFADNAPVAWERARLASERGDWPEAARRWDAVRAQFPDRPVAYLSGGAALRELGRLDEAERLLQEAAERFADNAPVAWERARLASERRDWPEAARRWDAVRGQFSDRPIAYLSGAVALRELGRLDEAEGLLEEAAGRFPDNPEIAWQRARLASERRDWAEAAVRWQAVRAHFPDRPIAYINGAAALREQKRLYEAERLLQEAAGRFPDNPQIGWERVRIAVGQRDWPEAKRRWAAAAARWPDELSLHLQALTTLDAISITLGNALDGRDEQVLAAARSALTRAKAAGVDNHVVYHLEFAVCRTVADWPETKRRWAGFVARWPDDLKGHIGVLTALNAVDEQDEQVVAAARAALTRVKAARIDNAIVQQLELILARKAADWLSVRQTIERMIANRTSPAASLLSELAMACWHLQDLDGAERAATRALAADPVNTMAVHVLVWIATTRGDEEKALAAYHEMTRIAPDSERWAFEYARLLYVTGRVDDATRGFADARRRWPDAPILEVWELNHAIKQPSAGETEDVKHTRISQVERELKDIAIFAPPDRELRRPPAVDGLHQDVIIAEAAGAETAVLVFTGPHDHLTLPITLFDRHLAAFGVTAVYLKDMQRKLYLNGVGSLGDYRQSVAALRQIVDRLGVRKVCAFGTELGGYAAIRYGVELGVDHIVGVGIYSGVVQEGELGSEPFRNFVRTRIDNSFSKDHLDLRAFLESHPYRATIDLVYGARERRGVDRAHAEYLATLPGVTLRPQAKLRAASVLRFMAARPDFRATLAELLQLRTPAAQRQDASRRQRRKPPPTAAAPTRRGLAGALPSAG